MDSNIKYFSQTDGEAFTLQRRMAVQPQTKRAPQFSARPGFETRARAAIHPATRLALLHPCPRHTQQRSSQQHEAPERSSTASDSSDGAPNTQPQAADSPGPIFQTPPGKSRSAFACAALTRWFSLPAPHRPRVQARKDLAVDYASRQPWLKLGRERMPARRPVAQRPVVLRHVMGYPNPTLPFCPLRPVDRSRPGVAEATPKGCTSVSNRGRCHPANARPATNSALCHQRVPAAQRCPEPGSLQLQLPHPPRRDQGPVHPSRGRPGLGRNHLHLRGRRPPRRHPPPNRATVPRRPRQAQCPPNHSSKEHLLARANVEGMTAEFIHMARPQTHRQTRSTKSPSTQ